MGDNEQTLGTQSPEGLGNDEGSTSDVLAQGTQDEGTQTNEPSQIPPTDASLEAQRERSGLGRKVASMEREFAGMRDTLSKIDSYLQNQYSQPPTSVPSEERPPVEFITTPEDVERVIDWRDKRNRRMQDTFAQRYISSVKGLNYVNPDMHTEIEKELLTNVGEYPTYSNFKDPIGDAHQNYLKAENKLLKAKLSGAVTRPNVRGGATQATGVTASTRVSAPPESSVKLDEYSSKFLSALGEKADADWVKESLGKKE